jgi:hypothetical protein
MHLVTFLLRNIFKIDKSSFKFYYSYKRFKFYQKKNYLLFIIYFDIWSKTKPFRLNRIFYFKFVLCFFIQKYKSLILIAWPYIVLKTGISVT